MPHGREFARIEADIGRGRIPAGLRDVAGRRLHEQRGVHGIRFDEHAAFGDAVVLHQTPPARGRQSHDPAEAACEPPGEDGRRKRI